MYVCIYIYIYIAIYCAADRNPRGARGDVEDGRAGDRHDLLNML